VDSFNASQAASGLPLATAAGDVEETISQLFRSSQNALSEYELFNWTFKLAKKHSLENEYRKYLDHLDIGALSAPQKYAISAALGLHLTDIWGTSLWNSLFQSDILNEVMLYQKQLDKRYNLQRLYSSRIQGLPTFFHYLRVATQEFTRKLLILKA